MILKRSQREDGVYQYQLKSGGTAWGFRYKYYDALKNRREVKRHGFDTENDAIRALLEIKVQVLDQSYQSIDSDDLTVGNWFKIWFETNESHWAKTTIRQREFFLNKILIPLLGDEKIKKLTKGQYIKKFINPLMDVYAHSSVKVFHNLFRIGINEAVEEEVLQRNRFKSVTIPDYGETKEKNFLTADQLQEFLNVAKETENITNYTMLLTLAYTGMRRGELTALKWKDIDFDNHIISVNATRDDKGYRKPKTQKSIRDIYIDPLLTKQLKRYKTWCKELLLPLKKRVTDNTFVFLSYQTTNPINGTTIWWAVKRVSKILGIDEYFTPHGLRHTHATILVSQGIPLQTIANRLGNSATMILDVYGHSFDELEKRSVEVFSSALKG